MAKQFRLETLWLADRTTAWKGFLEAYSPLMLQVIRPLASDVDEVSDAFVFVCEGLARSRFKRLRSFDPGGPAQFRTWLAVVVRNLCLDWHRHQHGRRRPLKSVRKMGRLEQELFRCIYTHGMEFEAAFHQLQAAFPGLTRQQATAGVVRINRGLASREHYLLAQGPRRHLTPVDWNKESNAPLTPISREPDPETAASTNQEIRRLKDSLQELAGQDRLILRLRFERELTLDQIAKLTGLETPQRVDRRIRKILEQLQSRLAAKKKD